MDSFAIHEQVSRILQSRAFATKAQLRKLLELLSKNVDSQAALTPDSVIRELWPDEVRTKRAADVATEMNRLRHALESYYSGEGEADPVAIVLPNRAAAAADGTHERRWILARPRDEDGSGGDAQTVEVAGAAPTPGVQAPADAAATQPGVRLELRPGKRVATAAVLGVLGVVGWLAVRMLAMPAQPHAGRFDGSALTIVDAEGKELWRKIFPEGFSDYYYKEGLATRIWFVDLEGKGHTSVLFVYLPGVEVRSHATTLICYSDRGKEKWRWTPGRELPELSGSPMTYWVVALAFLRGTANEPRRIVASSAHNYWYPNQIAILDSNGKTLSEYWHSGHLNHMLVTDLDGDGREEIVAAGISNGYRQATLLVLDSERVFGASAEPNRPELQIHGMGEAKERLRLLFPRSDLNQAMSMYNQVEDVTVERGTIRVGVQECEQLGCMILYEFDKNLRLLTAYAADPFHRIHAEFYLKGDRHPFDAKEEARFTRLPCLSGCKTDVMTFGTP